MLLALKNGKFIDFNGITGINTPNNDNTKANPQTFNVNNVITPFNPPGNLISNNGINKRLLKLVFIFPKD